MSSITQKPTRTHPADFAKVHEDEETKALGKLVDAFEGGHLRHTSIPHAYFPIASAAKMKEITKKPCEKYPMPLTEAQRIGYSSHPLPEQYLDPASRLLTTSSLSLITLPEPG